MVSALEYLSRNPLLNIGMIVPVIRDTAKFLYVENDGVCFQETKSGAYMMSVSSYETGCRLLQMLPCEGMFTFNQEFMLYAFEAKVKYSIKLETYQAVYLNDKRLKVCDDILVKELDISHFRIVKENYDVDVEADYLYERLEESEIFGGYAGSDLVGFVGTHAEGSIGILKVFDKFRRKGYGEALTSFMVNHQLAKNVVPYVQISVHNEASLALVYKLGFELSIDKIYWLF